MADWTIAALAEAIRAKKISPVEATREYQTPIEPSPAAGPTPGRRRRRVRRIARDGSGDARRVPRHPGALPRQHGGGGGRTPLLPQRNLAEIGYRVVINPNALEETQAMFAPPRVIESRVFARVPAAKLLEGPSFDRAGNLYVVDIPNGRVPASPRRAVSR